jgi:hypothetical protein
MMEAGGGDGEDRSAFRLPTSLSEGAMLRSCTRRTKAHRVALPVALLGVLLGALTPAASAQPAVLPQLKPGRGEGRLSVEGYITQYRLSAGQGERARPSGYGGRVLWSLAPRTDPERVTLATRTAVGPFAVFTPAAPWQSKVWHAGVQADFRLARSPLGGRLDPVLSLAAGGFRVEDPAAGSALLRGRPLPGLSARRSTTDFAFTPGLGARLFLSPGFAIRADVRAVMLVGERVRHERELAGGMSIVM